jgi:chromosome segregation ATPase
VAASLARAEQELLAAQDKEKEVHIAIKAIEAEMRRHHTEHEKTRKKCSHEQDLINNIGMEIRDLQAFEEEKLPDVNALQSEVEEINERMKSFNEKRTRAQVAQYCEERETRRSVKSLQSEIAKAQRRIDNEEVKRGNVAEVAQKYHAVLQHYDKAKKEITNCVKFRKAIERSINHHAKKFADFRKFIVFCATQFFQMLLSQRGYTGKLKFNHENETQTVQVNVEKI